MSRIELRIGDGAQDIEPFIQRRVIRMDSKNGRVTKTPEVMVFDSAGVGERSEVGSVDDGFG